MSGSVGPSSCRIADDERDRAHAAALMEADRGVDLMAHTRHFGGDVRFVVWPNSGSIQAVAALVLHADGTAFVQPPTRGSSNEVLAGLYAGVRQQAMDLEARTVLALLPPQLATLGPELVAQGYQHVGDVLTMRCENRPHIQTLARLAAQPFVLEDSATDDQRLAQTIEATYEGSLSDPALGSNQSAAGFLNRLKSESTSQPQRFVLQVDGADAAVCLLSRTDADKYLIVRYLGVHPEFRGRKLGAQLLATSLAREWQGSVRFASVDVDEANHFAVAVYEELGFRTVSRATEFVLPLAESAH